MKKKMLLSVLVFTLLLTSCAQPAASPKPTEVIPEPTPTVESTRAPTPTAEPTPKPTPTIEPTPTTVPTIAPTEAIGNEEYLEVFEAVWTTVDQTYFDPDFGGLDWDAIHDDYEPLIAAAEDDETFYQLLNQMLWELNVSHTGVGPADMWPSIEPIPFAEGEIGIDVRLLDDRAVITRVEAESPAEGAGLRPGFVIQGIDGVSIEQIIADAQGHLSPPYNEQGRINGLTRRILSLIYGDPETCVTLAYLDENDELHKQCIARIRRQRMAPMGEIPLPPSYLEFESGRFENGIGYIRFNTFHPSLIPDIVEAVAALQDAPGMIIDLRGNPGGDGHTGERLAGQFLDERASFGSLRTRDGTSEWYVPGEGVYDGPVVILIDALSYSCSEWFASGMQAAGRAVVIGERSPGGVTAMNVTTLPNGASLGYPVAQVLAPDGKVVEGYGVIPDIAVTLDRNQLLEGIDAQLEAGISGTSKGVYPGETWQEAATPEQLGWSSEKLAKAQEYSERIGSAAVMIVDDGVVVDAWGDITRNYLCHSMRKSLLSALYGIYVAEGKIDISKTLDELGIDDHTPLTEAEKQATVADLLRARSGVYIPAAGEAPAMKAMRPERGSHAPDTFWYYNNWDFNALGTIFDQETGEENMYQAFKTRIADPIGMQDFPIESLQYHYEPYSMHPYYNFRMSARDLARFALLFLREGRWKDQQIIPADWVQESTATYSQTGPDSGYGYMWWTGVKGGLFPNVEVKEHSYYASGWGGHEAIVLPYRNLVVVHRVNTDEAGQSVDTTQIGVLLWLILDAAGETEIGESPLIESAQGVRLTAENLQETIAGSTARSASGSGELVVSFSEDGTVMVSVAGALIDTGKWWTEDDKLCTEFTNPDLEDGCNLVMLDGTTMKLFDLDGTLEMKLEYSPGFAQSFEQEVERLREELNIPSLSVAVLQGQEVVFARGFGYADVENQIPATENTPYYIASCTKPFAAAVLMKLVEAGQLDLDAAMADILNDTTFPFPNGAIHGYAGLCETIIELSKDPSGPYAPYRSLFENYRCDTEPITVRHHLTHTSQGTPGEAYRYNGFLYGLLSWVAEATSQQSFADLLIEYVTDPLEMTSTIPNSSDSRRQQILAELAKPYRIDDAGNVVLADFTQDLNAGAGMVSTVLDLAKFDVAMARNQIVSQESKEAMFTPTLSNSGQPLPYGLGWFVQEHKGVQLIWHYGQQTTYSSLILKVPEEELTLILLANSDGASAPFNLGAGDVLTSPFAATFINLFTDVLV